MTRVFGIDFGTTNSAVVEYSQQRYTKIGDTDGNPFPSVVAIDRLTEEVRAGREVRKRLIELQADHSSLVIESVKTALATDNVWTVSGRRMLKGEDIAAELFKALAKKAWEFTHEPLREAVIAIPVGMTSKKRAALRRAAEAAGIRVSSLISEPTAAFLSHSGELHHCRYVAVFDWGGGTLDISILEVNGECVIERYTCGLDKAGDYIDKRLAEWLHLRLNEDQGSNAPFHSVTPSDRQRLTTLAERCKIKLQEKESEHVIIGRYSGVDNVTLTVSRGDFEELIRDTIAEVVDLLVTSVEKAKLSLKEIGGLIVVGGSSNLLMLQKALRTRWPSPNIIFPQEAEWDVAKGAAWLAANPGSYRTAESLGLVLADGEYYEIFPSGTRIQDATSKLHLGLVEDAEPATILFASCNSRNGHPAHLGELHVEAFGFSNELIELDTRITDDLVFQANACSDFKPKSFRPFAFDNLRWVYEVPRDD